MKSQSVGKCAFFLLLLQSSGRAGGVRMMISLDDKRSKIREKGDGTERLPDPK